MESTADDSRIMKMQLVHPSMPLTNMEFLDRSILSFKTNQMGEKAWDVEITYVPDIAIWHKLKGYKKIDSISIKGINKAGDTLITQQFSNITGVMGGLRYNGIETVVFCMTYKCSLVYED